MEAAFLESTSMMISELGNSRMIETNLRAGSVVEPGFSTLASTRQRMATCRSVVVIHTPFSSASRRALVRIGSVGRLLTTF